MLSALYHGVVRHRRFAPVAHEFRYAVTYLYLDLAELGSVFAGRWLWSASRPSLVWFRRADHLGDPDRPLDACVRDLVERETGLRPSGPVRLLTFPRWLGYGFNPVSFFYCWDAADRTLEAIVAEVSNTPWGERHCYVLSAAHGERRGERWRFRFAKDFHVSPFMPMEQRYDWSFSAPGACLAVHMENHQEGQRLFDATLALRRHEITGRSLALSLVRYPLMPAKAIAAIYLQALRLRLAGAPFHAHPRAPQTRSERSYA